MAKLGRLAATLVLLSAAALAGPGCSVSTAVPEPPPAAAGVGKTKIGASGAAPVLPQEPAGPPIKRAKGGNLRLGLPHEPASLDPALALDHESIVCCENIFDTLVRYSDGSCDIEPALAESWDFTKDELTWVFQLRQGAKFHDGTPVTADSVAFSFQRQMDPTHPNRPGDCVFWTRLMQAVREVRVLDPYRVALELKRPYSPLLAALAMPQCSIVSADAVKKLGADFGKKPVGSGPFKVSAWSVGKSLALSANTEYWGAKPSLDGATIRGVPDPAARLLQLARGDLDAMEQIASDDVAFAVQSGLRIEKLPGLNLVYLAINTDPILPTAVAPKALTTEEVALQSVGPVEMTTTDLSPLRARARYGLRSSRIRKALARAVDKSAICTDVYGGLAVPATGPLPPTLWGRDESLKDHDFDPVMGRQLLDQAGYAQNFSLELLVLEKSRSYLPDPRKLAHTLRKQIEREGVDVRSFRVVDFDRLHELVQAKDYECCLSGWTGDIGDPDNFLYTLFDPDNINPPDSTNLSFFENDFLHQALIEGQGHFHRVAREQAYKAALDVILQNEPIIPIVHIVDTLVTKVGKVDGLKLHPVGFRRLVSAALAQ